MCVTRGGVKVQLYGALKRRAHFAELEMWKQEARLYFPSLPSSLSLTHSHTHSHTHTQHRLFKS